MQQPLVPAALMLSLIATQFIRGLASTHHESKILKVGEELWKETIPLHAGSDLYELHGLEPFTWYEVKISYPASIPASFTLQLRRDSSDLGLHRQRRLLNTEKLIFQYDRPTNQGPWYVLVTVVPEGVVAIPDAKDREFIVYNIVCDELMLGIPHKAWWVFALVLLCLSLAVMIPRYLPPFLLPSNGSKTSQQQSVKKS